MGKEKPPATLAEALSELVDFRRAHLRVHGLVSVLQVSVAAMLCGARSEYAISQWARERLADSPSLLEALGCEPERSPSNATIHRGFKGLDAPAFERILGSWLSRLGLKPQEPLAVDGKSLRGIHGEKLPGVHLVSVYALETEAVLAQVTAGGKGTELPAVKQALAQVPLEGKVVIGDALQTQREGCQQIAEGGGDSLFPVKENQPTLLSDLHDAFFPAR